MISGIIHFSPYYLTNVVHLNNFFSFYSYNRTNQDMRICWVKCRPFWYQMQQQVDISCSLIALLNCLHCSTSCNWTKVLPIFISHGKILIASYNHSSIVVAIFVNLTVKFLFLKHLRIKCNLKFSITQILIIFVMKIEIYLY